MWQTSITVLFTIYRDWASEWEKTHLLHRWKGRRKGEGQTKLYFSVCLGGVPRCPLCSRRWDHCWALERWWSPHLLCFDPPYSLPLEPCLCSSCIFNAFLPTKFFHLACKQAQDSFTPPSKISLDSHPLILYFSKSSPRGYHILLFSFWVFLKYCFPDSTLFLLICCCSQPLWM